jgi:hypothetical protein
VLRKGRASDVLLRLLVCEHDLRSAAADAKVISSFYHFLNTSFIAVNYCISAFHHSNTHHRLAVILCAQGNWVAE